MASQIIAVCGQSAVGKSTFLERLRKGEDIARRRLGIETGTVAVCGPGFAPLNAEHIAKDHVAWKWQFDIHHWIELLFKDYSLIRHRIVVLLAEPEEHRRRWIEKHRTTNREFTDSLGRAVYDEHMRLLARTIRPTAGRLGIPLEFFDATTPEYQPMNLAAASIWFNPGG